MVIDSSQIRSFEDGIARKEGPIPHGKALEIFTALWQEAMSLGIIPASDPMEGIEIDFKLARILNSCSRNSSPA